MSLESGLYSIHCLENGNTVNRFPVEDLSLLPKRIMSFKREQNFGVAPWIIEKCGDDTYKMKAGGAPVGEHAGRLVAFLIMEEQAREWKIEPCPQMGENCFVIMKPDEPVGWSVPEPEGEHVQLVVHPLVSTRSLPPRYLPNEVFVITKATME